MASLHELGLVELQALLRGRQVSAKEVVEAFLARIDAVDPKLHAMTWVDREHALGVAMATDLARSRGERLPPLAGLPLTIKECIDVEGTDSTMGLRARRGSPASRDAVVVQVAREQGAIVLGKTNVSQLLLFTESRNAVFGQTANPWNLARTPGGSSGGEAAIIAAGGSPAGIGSDLGGSIRIPAHFCGVAGLKPTVDRWSVRGVHTALLGQEAVRGMVGPMARQVADLALLVRTLPPERMAELDPRVPPMSFVDPASISIRGMRIGYYDDDGLLTSSAALRRAVKRATQILADRDCELVPMVPPRAADAWYQYLATASSDGGRTIDWRLQGESLDVALRMLRNLLRIPTAARKAAAIGLRGRDPKLARLLDSIGGKSVFDFWQLTNERNVYRFELLEAWDDARVDAVVCPPFATPAIPHEAARDFTIGACYSMLYNYANFPAGVVPVTRVRPGETERSLGKGRFEQRAAELDRGTEGLPVGVQVVARPWRDEVALAVMAAIEAGVKGDDGFPARPPS
ncbi:MAG: amidase [Deltaproteobacteria bacterium]|nr:amidase [Deltaproteobacteria bacterium]